MADLRTIQELSDEGDVRLLRAERVGVHYLLREAPELRSRERLQREERNLRMLDSSATLRLLELTQEADRYALVFEDPGGQTLRRWIGQGAFPLRRFLPLAIDITGAVQALHNREFMHRSLRPDCIWVAEDSSVRLIDLSDLSRNNRYVRELEINNRVQRLLPYMAPELSGRLKRSADHRADLYSLGCIFYEMLTGQPPFQGDDALEILHGHIARHPLPIEDHVSDTSGAIQKIIARLLAKPAEERYQSASGLIADLTRCDESLRRLNRIEDFEVGQSDVPNRFQVSQKLYGRDAEVGQMLDALDRVEGGEDVRVAVIQGPPGSGKSALLREVESLAATRKLFFASGKFEQFERSRPYVAWIAACGSLLQAILRENEDEIERWRSSIRSAVQPNAAVLLQIVPMLERLVGAQREATDLPPAESRNRLQHAFNRFLECFARPEHPLVLFLDDLQWADSASLDLLSGFILDPQIGNVLVLLSYRSEAAEEEHPVQNLLSTISHRAAIDYVEPRPLNVNDLAQLIIDTMHCSTEEALPLAGVLQARTHGNPFFVNQFLLTLHRDGWLRFHPDYHRWVWNFNEISDLKITENVVDFMSAQIQSLGEEAQHVLSTAACLGSTFLASTLEHIVRANTQVLDVLESAVNEGLLIEHYNGDEVEPELVFVHDQVRQAAYSILAPRERAHIHRQLGERMLHDLTDAQIEARIFDLLEHWNASLEFLDELSRSERFRIASMNRIGARRARTSAAVSSALTFAQAGLLLLPEDAWKKDYDLALELHIEAMQSAYLNAEHELAEELFKTLQAEVRSSLESARVYVIRVTLFTNRGEHAEAIRQGIEGLRRLNYRLPEDPGLARVLGGALQVRYQRIGRSPESFLDLPPMKDRDRLAIMELLMAMTPSAFFIRANLFGLIVLRMVSLSLKYGNAPQSPYAYMTYAILLLSAFGKIELADRFGKLALELNERIRNADLDPRLNVIYGAFINHHVDDMRINMRYLRTAFRQGLEQGDYVYAGYALANRIFASFARGDDLKEQDRLARAFLRFTDRTGDRDVENDFLVILQTNKNLRGETPSVHSFNDDSYNEEEHEKEMADGNPVTLILYLLARAQNAYLFGEPMSAYGYLMRVLPILEPGEPLTLGPEFHFLRGLAVGACLRSGERIKNGKSILKKEVKRLVRLARFSPMNYAIPALLLRAELAAVNGDRLEAIELYSRAMQRASHSQHVRLRVYIGKAAAQFHASYGAKDLSSHYEREAIAAAESWGATALVKETGGSSASTRGLSEGLNLDIEAVSRAARAISGEIVFERLLERLMEIVLLQSGARQGFLIQVEERAMIVEARGEADGSPHVTVERRELNPDMGISRSILSYALNTGEAVVVEDASDSMFRSDDVVRERGLKSILCVPIRLQGSIYGLLYLENNLSAGAFTRDRLEALNILAAQAAVSIENAHLYMDLEQKVQERTRELEATLSQVQALKTRQDSDYYLTALLIEPLSRVSVRSDHVRVDTFVQQKKSFQFKNWKESIGGDVCLARSIVLQGKAHTVFVNADAMGKSIQGAGGVLVLGSVFEALAGERNVLPELSQASPDEWLLRCYDVLNTVFRSFQGYMLLTGLFGIIEDDTGKALLLNAEHPSAVLLRNGKAAFLDEPENLKLGTFWMDRRPEILRVQLEQGDILICGSDGRDDILMKDHGGVEQINEERNLFLNRVRACDGSLERIARSIMADGELTDDLSLIRIEYTR